MNKMLIWQTDSTSSAATEAFGERIAHNLKGGEAIELISDLGSGKTTLVRGLARGLGSRDHVNSPTFKISNVYRGDQLTLYHFDFYRLDNPGMAAHELHDALTDPRAVVVVEWGDVVQDVLPAKRLSIKLATTGEQLRRIIINYPKSLSYLLEPKP